jgi:hypothetical protein
LLDATASLINHWLKHEIPDNSQRCRWPPRAILACAFPRAHAPTTAASTRCSAKRTPSVKIATASAAEVLAHQIGQFAFGAVHEALTHSLRSFGQCASPSHAAAAPANVRSAESRPLTPPAWIARPTTRATSAGPAHGLRRCASGPAHRHSPVHPAPANRRHVPAECVALRQVLITQLRHTGSLRLQHPTHTPDQLRAPSRTAPPPVPVPASAATAAPALRLSLPRRS